MALASLLLALVLGMLGRSPSSPEVGARHRDRLHHSHSRHPDLVLMMLLFFGGQVLISGICSLGQRGLQQLPAGEQSGTRSGSPAAGLHRHQPLAARVATIELHLRRLHDRDLPRRILAVDKESWKPLAPLACRRPRCLYGSSSQMMRHALPGFGNNWLVLLETTALVSIIGLDDMVRKASLAAGSTQQPFAFYMAVALIFLIFTAVSDLGAQSGPSVTTPSRRG